MESKGDAKLVCSNVVTLFFRCLRKYFPSDMYVDMDSFRGRKISLINETGFRGEQDIGRHSICLRLFEHAK